MALNIAKSPLVGPVLALNGWTFVMEIWMYALRIPAINRAAEQGKLKVDPSMTKEDMNKALPVSVRWSADNFNHLFEQPTQFYSVALALALIGADDDLNVKLAWGYVGVRIVHSLLQATTNVIMRRFGLFALSSAVLATLTARGALQFFS